MAYTDLERDQKPRELIGQEKSSAPLTLGEFSRKIQRAFPIFFGAVVIILIITQVFHLSFFAVLALLIASLGVYLWFALRWLRRFSAWQKEQKSMTTQLLGTPE